MGSVYLPITLALGIFLVVSIVNIENENEPDTNILKAVYSLSFFENLVNISLN